MLVSAESQVPKLIIREIIFEGIPTRVIKIHQRYRRTDNLSRQFSLRYASRGKNKKAVLSQR